MITAEELEKLAELKDKGIITEDEFNAKRDEFLNQDINNQYNKKLNSIKFLSKKYLIFCFIIFVAIGGYLIKKPHQISNDSNIGKNGFNITLRCLAYGSPVAFQSCATKSEVELSSGANKKVYNLHNMPITYDNLSAKFTVPQYFDFYVYNGHSTFTIEIIIEDISTHSIIAKREVSSYDGDRIGN